MAKMFYTIEEAADKLGVSEDEIKEMVGEGKLQQFRDRDKLMFKRDQVDSLSGSSESGEYIPLADSGETDAIDLSADSSVMAVEVEDPREATGVSVFDASEIEPADPLAQTQVTSNMPDDDELALESVGSGSGLLDLTRESDDTSLGAELLDEIYPGDTGQGSMGGSMGATGGSMVSGTGIFESAAGMETGFSGPSGLSHMTGDASMTDAPAMSSGNTGPTMVASYDDAVDGAGSGMSAGALIGAAAALVIALIVMVNITMGLSGGLVDKIAGDPGARDANGIYMWVGGLAVLAIIGAIVGLFVGKAAE